MAHRHAVLPTAGGHGDENEQPRKAGHMAEERTLGKLVADATSEISGIVRAEIALAKAEIKVDVKNGALGGGLFGAAGYLALVASILLFIAAAYGLVAAGLAAWLAFLLVAAVLLVVAAVLALVGRSHVSKVGPPERTIRTTRETLEAIKPGSPRAR
jgi:hypothetical protein